MNKAAFLDRDGVINIDRGYVHKPEDFIIMPGAIDVLKYLQEKGYLLIIITNQSGIARGYYTEEDFLKFNEWMTEQLDQKGIVISKTYYCPHLTDAVVLKYKMNCACRKPGKKLFYDACIDFNIDINQSIVIGDRVRDCTICESTNCKGFLISQDEVIPASLKRVKRIDDIREVMSYV